MCPKLYNMSSFFFFGEGQIKAEKEGKDSRRISKDWMKKSEWKISKKKISEKE